MRYVSLPRPRTTLITSIGLVILDTLPFKSVNLANGSFPRTLCRETLCFDGVDNPFLANNLELKHLHFALLLFYFLTNYTIYLPLCQGVFEIFLQGTALYNSIVLSLKVARTHEVVAHRVALGDSGLSITDKPSARVLEKYRIENLHFTNSFLWVWGLPLGSPCGEAEGYREGFKAGHTLVSHNPLVGVGELARRAGHRDEPSRSLGHIVDALGIDEPHTGGALHLGVVARARDAHLDLNGLTLAGEQVVGTARGADDLGSLGATRIVVGEDSLTEVARIELGGVNGSTRARDAHTLGQSAEHLSAHKVALLDVATAGIALVAHNGFGILKVRADNIGSGEHSGNLSRPCSSGGLVGLSPILLYCTTIKGESQHHNAQKLEKFFV